MSQPRSLSKSSERALHSMPRQLVRPSESESLTPTLVESSSSSVKFNPQTTTFAGALATQVEEGSLVATMQKNLVHGRRKRSFRCALFEAGDRDEDFDTPAKRPKILQTTWNYTPSSSASSDYISERMLELSRVTRRAIAARMRYQRICSHELDLMKSILEDETATSQKHMNSVDSQIGSLRNLLHDKGVVIGNKGYRFDHDGHGQAWCESSDDSEADSVIVGFDNRSSCESGCASETDE